MIILLILLLLCIISINTFHLKVSSLSQSLSSLSLNVVTGRYTQIYPEQPSFFPRSLDELASDTCASAQVGLMNEMLRMRVDIRMRLVRREKNMLTWLILTAQKLIDAEFQHIHCFVEDKKDLDMCNDLWKAILVSRLNNNTNDIKNEIKKISFSSIDDSYFKDDIEKQIIIIFNPDNIIEGSNPSLLDNVQCLCFKAALKKVPVIIINPELIANAWNDVGPVPPLLLSDFSQIYFASDEYFMMPSKHQWAGLIQRAGSGTDLFLLSGMTPGKYSPDDFICVNSWKECIPDDIRNALVQLLRKSSSFKFFNNITAANEKSTTTSSESLASIINKKNPTVIRNKII